MGGRDVAFARLSLREDAQPIARARSQAAGSSLDLQRELGKRVGVNRARVAAFDNGRRAARVAKEDRRHVLAADSKLDALRLAVEARRFAHEKARDVEHVRRDRG